LGTPTTVGTIWGMARFIAARGRDDSAIVDGPGGEFKGAEEVEFCSALLFYPPPG
jgi:hypothetical protein